MEDLQKKLELICNKVQELLEEHEVASDLGVSIENMVFKTKEKMDHAVFVKSNKKLGFTCRFNDQGQWVCKP
jgi:hypothetical protein